MSPARGQRPQRKESTVHRNIPMRKTPNILSIFCFIVLYINTYKAVRPQGGTDHTWWHCPVFSEPGCKLLCITQPHKRGSVCHRWQHPPPPADRYSSLGAGRWGSGGGKQKRNSKHKHQPDETLSAVLRVPPQEVREMVAPVLKSFQAQVRWRSSNLTGFIFSVFFSFFSLFVFYCETPSE